MKYWHLKEFAKEIRLEGQPTGYKALRAAIVHELEKSGPWSEIAEGVEKMAQAVTEKEGVDAKDSLKTG